jgi:hypothetical protein
MCAVGYGWYTGSAIVALFTVAFSRGIVHECYRLRLLKGGQSEGVEERRTGLGKRSPDAERPSSPSATRHGERFREESKTVLSSVSIRMPPAGFSGVVESKRLKSTHW